jgi:uncharacterized protein (TIGR02145 family)
MNSKILNYFIIQIVLFFVVKTFSFSQSKKEQIIQLNSRVDSLNSILSLERNSNLKKISDLNSTIHNLEDKNSVLRIKLDSIDILKSQIKNKSDSLNITRKELDKIKAGEKAKNTNNKPPQSGIFKSVKIGDQIWMQENLNVSKFRNDDPIPEAKTDEEWLKANQNGKPAWCYYSINSKNYGKLYNWYAVNDPRGLAPEGWHIPSYDEWSKLANDLGENAGSKLKSTTGWKIREEDNSNSTKSGNGNNSSGFAATPGGSRLYDGTFNYAGNYGYWWSSTKNGSLSSWNFFLSYEEDDSILDSSDIDWGFSVRCIQD